jgi:hypothetical protein
MLVGHTFLTANQSLTGILYNKKSDYGTVLQYLFLNNITRGFAVQGVHFTIVTLGRIS